MSDLSLGQWASAAGGASGFFSFLYVLWKGFKSGAKLVTSVKRVEFTNKQDQLQQNRLIFRVLITLEIGNVGTEYTTVTGAILKVKGIGKEMKLRKLTELGYVNSYDTIAYAPGEANHQHFSFCEEIDKNIDGPLDMVLILSLIGDKKVKIPLHTSDITLQLNRA